mgnify:FL=1
MSLDNELQSTESREHVTRGLDRRTMDRRAGSNVHPIEAGGFGATILVSLGLLVTAAVHIIDLPGKEPRYAAYLYMGLIITAVGLAIINAIRPSVLSLVLSGALCLAVLVGFVLTRTVGLPNWTDDIGNWGEPLGVVSLITETFTVIFAGIAIYAKKSTRF